MVHQFPRCWFPGEELELERRLVDGGQLRGLADPCLVVPSLTAARIQEMHLVLGQMLCGAVETALGLTGDGP